MSASSASPAILTLRGVCMAFPKPSGELLPAVADVDLCLHDGEMVGLLGRSGSGKSTLLRVAGGLIQPTSGSVLYRGAPLTAPAAGIGFVFQTFALYPWLTVEENVELGLDALKLPAAQARQRSAAAIDLIGLDGFQSAYPRELSGGMRQRVGFARALVSDPVLLLLDEPFSALDVLTAEVLRTDFLDLWHGHLLPTRAVLLVTHNIEEAVLLCDRILVLASHPGRIAAEIHVPLPQPRDRGDAELQAIVGELYSALTARMNETAGSHCAHDPLARPLPRASINRLLGLIETLAAGPYDGHAELARIAAALGLPSDELLPLAGALHILELAELQEGALKLTAAGRVFAGAGTDERKRLFREHLLRFAPLVTHIQRVLEERPDHRAPRERFELELQDHLSGEDADQTLRTATGWGRYAELFTYDDDTRAFELKRPGG